MTAGLNTLPKSIIDHYHHSQETALIRSIERRFARWIITFEFRVDYWKSVAGGGYSREEETVEPATKSVPVETVEIEAERLPIADWLRVVLSVNLCQRRWLALGDVISNSDEGRIEAWGYILTWSSNGATARRIVVEKPIT